jgi:hypothetical protein
MSRHEIPARNPAHKVIVGWDHPLLTFFVQVIDREREDAGDDLKMILWRGTSLRELYEVEDVRRTVAAFADLSPEIGAKLYGDKDEGR